VLGQILVLEQVSRYPILEQVWVLLDHVFNSGTGFLVMGEVSFFYDRSLAMGPTPLNKISKLSSYAINHWQFRSIRCIRLVCVINLHLFPRFILIFKQFWVLESNKLYQREFSISSKYQENPGIPKIWASYLLSLILGETFSYAKHVSNFKLRYLWHIIIQSQDLLNSKREL